MPKRLLYILLLIPLLAACGSGTPATDESGHRAVYYWKTTLRIGEQEKDFLARHDIDRMYLRMFDVDVDIDYTKDEADVIPVATLSFESAVPDSIEIIPTVFITLNALKHCEGGEEELAGKIVTRVLNMCSYNDLGPIREVQFDCDWTESTRHIYDRLCGVAKDLLHAQGVALSGTIRLHQVEQAEYPFDSGVLMLYNTGAVKDPDTGNSILAYEDVEKYLGVPSRIGKFRAARRHNCSRIDFAYPTFSWKVEFTTDGVFRRIIPDSGRGAEFSDGIIRREFPEFSEIKRVKDLVSATLGTDGSNIIYHLDCGNLSKYTDDEIEDILR